MSTVISTTLTSESMIIKSLKCGFKQLQCDAAAIEFIGLVHFLSS